MTLQSLLNKSILELKNAGIKSAEIDAKLLLMKTTSKNDVFIFSHPEYLITNSQYYRFRHHIRKRKIGEPIAYILGHKEFFGNDFIVNKNVLIPRPETEWLVEKSIVFFQNQESRIKNYEKINILDVGTGSGCIIISLIKSLLDSRFMIHDSVAFYATDISKKAIAVAKKNSKNHKVDNYIKFYNSDLFSNRFLNKKFDLITANLPYVPRHQNHESRIMNHGIKEGISFEPQSAIFADDDGMAIVKRFLIEAKSHVVQDGLILLELDCRNAKSILEFAKKQFPHSEVELIKDLAGLDRYVEINV
ncbi:MAG: peptide chain release factor N(5)-glutamine methyltransferase [Patescibacteria group bacterium]